MSTDDDGTISLIDQTTSGDDFPTTSFSPRYVVSYGSLWLLTNRTESDRVVEQ